MNLSKPLDHDLTFTQCGIVAAWISRRPEGTVESALSSLDNPGPWHKPYSLYNSTLHMSHESTPALLTATEPCRCGLILHDALPNRSIGTLYSSCLLHLHSWEDCNSSYMNSRRSPEPRLWRTPRFVVPFFVLVQTTNVEPSIVREFLQHPSWMRFQKIEIVDLYASWAVIWRELRRRSR